GVKQKRNLIIVDGVEHVNRLRLPVQPVELYVPRESFGSGISPRHLVNRNRYARGCTDVVVQLAPSAGPWRDESPHASQLAKCAENRRIRRQLEYAIVHSSVALPAEYALCVLDWSEAVAIAVDIQAV